VGRAEHVALPGYFRRQLVPALPGRHRPRCRDTGPCFRSWYAQAVVIHNRLPYLIETQGSAARDLVLPDLLTASEHRMRPILRLDDPGRTLAGLPPLEIACSDHTQRARAGLWRPGFPVEGDYKIRKFERRFCSLGMKRTSCEDYATFSPERLTDIIRPHRDFAFDPRADVLQGRFRAAVGSMASIHWVRSERRDVCAILPNRYSQLPMTMPCRRRRRSRPSAPASHDP